MEQPKWEMSTETKKIGEYICYKATMIKIDRSIDWGGMFRRGRDNDTKKDSTKSKEIVAEKTLAVTAWYTPQIPVRHGPSDYWGLPGLILEVSVGNTTLLCSKIVMNPKEKIKIEAPDKGKVVTKKEYKEIITGKMQEMRNNRGRGSYRR